MVFIGDRVVSLRDINIGPSHLYVSIYLNEK